MIVFGWLLAFAVLVAAVVVFLSLPSAVRAAGSRDRRRFSWAPLSVAVAVAAILAGSVVAVALVGGIGR